jgi:nitrate reductase gamma subunit
MCLKERLEGGFNCILLLKGRVIFPLRRQLSCKVLIAQTHSTPSDHFYFYFSIIRMMKSLQKRQNEKGHAMKEEYRLASQNEC